MIRPWADNVLPASTAPSSSALPDQVLREGHDVFVLAGDRH